MLLGICVCGSLFAQTPDADTAMQKEQAAREQRIKWWSDAKFGMFIHWGLYAVPGGVWKDKVHPTGYSEWIMFGEKVPVKEYEQLAGKFNPVKFDAKAWASIAKKAGMRYMVLTAKHHEGFSMFKSKLTPYNVVDATPFKRDVTGELSAACRSAGMHFGCYYSIDRDWYRPQGPGNNYKQNNVWDYPDSKKEDFDKYVATFAKPQVEELLVNYRPDLLWFDEIDMKSDAQVEDLYQSIRKLRPECIINSRIQGCRFPSKIPPPHCDYITSGDNEILEKAPGFEWENPGSMNTSYGYNQNDHNWVEPKEIVRRLVDIVSKGGNYLLNVGPTSEGLIPQACIDRLMEVGAWMDVNQEAIYGTKVWKIHGEDKKAEDKTGVDVRFTTKGNSLYATCLAWPEKDVVIKALGANELTGKTITAVSMLGSKEKIKWNQADDGLALSVPKEKPCNFAFVYRIDFKVVRQTGVKKDFVEPPLKFRSRPLWFWNNTEVTAAGVEAALKGNRDKSGYGGLAPLPFGAKFTPKYLSEEYFDLYGVAVKKARELGMFLTIYDEYGFPSGSAGASNGDGIPRFKNKYPDDTLRRLDKVEEDVMGPGTYSRQIPAGKLMSLVAMKAGTQQIEDLTRKVKDGSITWDIPAGSWKIMIFVCVPDGDPNVDYLEPERVAKFVDLVYRPYYEKFGKDFGKTIGGAFYDEPTMYRGHGRLWTEKFNEKFFDAYGLCPARYYPALWYDIGPETQAARNLLFGFRTELYASGYVKVVQDWCTAHGRVPLLGHQDQENIKNPVGVSGDLMKSYKYQDVPGIDKIGWDNDPEAYYKIVSSVAYNWDKEQAMTETYGAMGNLSWDRLYTIVMEQYAKGINNFVQHGVWYNLDNITYLPELSYRNPRYADGLQAYNTYIGRLNVLLQDKGRHVADIAVLYPIATLQAGYHFDGPLGPYCGGVNVPEADYIYLGELLATKVCRDFTFLHPEVLEERCSIKGDLLKLNNKVNYEEYKVLIMPGHETISFSSLKKIKEYYDNGGKVIATGKLPTKSAELSHDLDVVAIIKEMFPGVKQQILATACNEWRESGAFEAAKAIDGSKETRWAPSEAAAKEWWLEINLGAERTFNSTAICEVFDRVNSYSIQYWDGKGWATCASGTTIGANKVDKFAAVTASMIRLLISGAANGNPSISEFELHMDDGPNLAHSDALIVKESKKGGLAIYLNSPNETNLRKALDQALKVYDVDIESSQKLRYIHRVKDKNEVYFFANIGDKDADASVRLRGKIKPEAWDPHTGRFSTPEYSHSVEDGQPVTKVKLALKPVQSIFIVGR